MKPAAMPPSPADTPDAGQGDQPLYVIELSCMPDGTYQVELESGAQEDAEGSGGDDDSGAAAPQTAKSWEEAMQIADQLHQQQEGSDGPSKQSGFDSVFDKTGGMG